MKIAVFGSAFNPPTLGHADAIKFLQETYNFDEIWLVPSYKHAFSKAMLDYDLRVSMLHEFTTDLDNESIKPFAIENKIALGDKPVFTWDLLSYLQNKYQQYQFSFVMGPDNKANWHKFHKAQEIQQNWQLIVVPERQKIRSSIVRSAIENNTDISELVTPSVAGFIANRYLYR